MDVRAVILVGTGDAEAVSRPSTTTSTAEQPKWGAEHLAGVPIGLLDVAGESVVHRVLTRLERFGVTDACVVTEVPASSVPGVRSAMRPTLKWVHGTGAQFWRSAENAFSEFAQAGAELVLVLRVGCYTELDFEEFIQLHLDRGARVTCAVDGDGTPLDAFVISASRRNDAAFMLRHDLKGFRSPCETYHHSGYTNRLQDAVDLRRLTLDCFSRVVSFSPAGTEIRPGVWAGEGVRIHRTARVLAPCYIGSYSKIQALSVVTRGSVIEHHSEVDCGTVVENSSVLPFCYVGPGLDVCQSVLGFRRIANLKWSVEVDVSEPKFIGSTIKNPAVRTMKNAVSLAVFVPAEFVGGFFKKRKRGTPATLPEAINTPAAALNTPALQDKNAQPQDGDFPANLVVARRYGNE